MADGSGYRSQFSAQERGRNSWKEKILALCLFALWRDLFLLQHLNDLSHSGVSRCNKHFAATILENEVASEGLGQANRSRWLMGTVGKPCAESRSASYRRVQMESALGRCQRPSPSNPFQHGYDFISGLERRNTKMCHLSAI